MPLQLCFVRHAIAEERGLRWPDDRERPLTSAGEARMREATRGLWALFAPQTIFTSPLVRARQTADILAEGRPEVAVHSCEALASGDHDALLAAVRAAGSERIAVVGHEPTISQALSFALTGDEDAVALLFRKGAAALVSFVGAPAPGAAGLEWLLQPAALRAVGRAPVSA